MSRNNTLVILIEKDKCAIWDIKNNKHVRTIPRWNGYHTKDGKYGLYTPNIGGLELIDLKTGKTVRQILGRSNEGMYHANAFFMNNDEHVVYYHGMHQIIRVVRMRDLRIVSELHVRADVTCFELADNGTSLVLAGEGGGVYTQTLADPEQPSSRRRLASLPNRTSHLHLYNPDQVADQSPAKLSFGAATRIVSLTNRIRTTRQKSDSQTCAIS